jgi:hypothetical protein
VDHGDLIGLWESTPYDYGSLETCWLGFLQDGRGWSAWATMAGGIDVSRFRWHCPVADVLELHYEWHACGDWQQTGNALTFATITEQEPGGEVVRTGFVIGPDETFMIESPFIALHLELALQFCKDYAFRQRDISLEDDPAHDVFPWSSPAP